MTIATQILFARGTINTEAIERFGIRIPPPPAPDDLFTPRTHADHIRPFTAMIEHAHGVRKHRHEVHAEHKTKRAAHKAAKEAHERRTKHVDKYEDMKRLAIARAEAKVEAKHAETAHQKRIERRKKQRAGAKVRYRRPDGSYGERRNPHFGKAKVGALDLFASNP
jgi:hypothetical protein